MSSMCNLAGTEEVFGTRTGRLNTLDESWTLSVDVLKKCPECELCAGHQRTEVPTTWRGRLLTLNAAEMGSADQLSSLSCINLNYTWDSSCLQ